MKSWALIYTCYFARTVEFGIRYYILNLILIPQVSIASTPHQGSLSLYQMETITESYTRHNAEINRSGGSRPTDYIAHLCIRKHHRRGGGKIERVRHQEVCCSNVSFRKGSTNKPGIVTWKGINILGPHFYLKNCRK